jgi:hypothetical protein
VKSERIKQLAQQYNLSESAIMSLADALQRGNGKMAQFNHPELGGNGQWMPGMMMIGDMFNNDLKARVQGVCEALAKEVDNADFMNMSFSMSMAQNIFWDSALGQPNTAGSQNNAHYAYFADKNRLVIKRDGTVYLYNTTGYVIVGVMQGQSNMTKLLKFKTRTGSVAEADFDLIHTRPS